MKKIFVTGCFDMLHSGHVAFLQETAEYGDLYVGLGSDNTVYELKGRHPVNSQQERQYMISALRCVKSCVVNSGSGYLDFLQELKQIKPDMFIVNGDGNSPEKEALCKKMGIEYRVLQRIPHPGLPARSTTAIRQITNMPYRVDLAGGWLDQPFVSEQSPGWVVSASIEPTVEFNERSGMATSTRKAAIEMWPGGLPGGAPQKLAKMLFTYDNPPGTEEFSGSQDALGIVLPGINRFYYRGDYWPEEVQSVLDEEVIKWLESHICLLPLWPRSAGFDVFRGMQVTAGAAKQLAAGSDKTWEAIKRMDVGALGAAVQQAFAAQVAMFPAMSNPDIQQVIDQYKDRMLGCKISGAGGGGYLIMVVQKLLQGTIYIKIRR